MFEHVCDCIVRISILLLISTGVESNPVATRPLKRAGRCLRRLRRLRSLRRRRRYHRLRRLLCLRRLRHIAVKAVKAISHNMVSVDSVVSVIWVCYQVCSSGRFSFWRHSTWRFAISITQH